MFSQSIYCSLKFLILNDYNKEAVSHRGMGAQVETTFTDIFLFCYWINTELKFQQFKLKIQFLAKVLGPKGNSGT